MRLRGMVVRAWTWSLRAVAVSATVSLATAWVWSVRGQDIISLTWTSAARPSEDASWCVMERTRNEFLIYGGRIGFAREQLAAGDPSPLELVHMNGTSPRTAPLFASLARNIERQVAGGVSLLWLVLASGLVSVLVCNGPRRAARSGAHCRRCSYDLTGNTSGTCPECGTSIERTTVPTGSGRAE